MKRNDRNELRAQMAATILSGLVQSVFVQPERLVALGQDSRAYNPFREDGKDAITDVAIILADKLLQEIDNRAERCRTDGDYRPRFPRCSRL